MLKTKSKTKTKLLFTLILGVIVLAFACRKDLINGKSLTELDAPMNVEIAKKIFNELKKEKGKFVKVRKANPELSKANIPENYNNRRYALYQKAYLSETDKSTFVEIPIVYNQRYSLTVINPKTFAKTSVSDRQLVFKYSFDRFIAYKDKKTGKISTRMVTYIPGVAYLKKHNYKIKHNQINKLDSDFSGFIEFKEWNGDGIYLLQYENGKKTGYISFKKAIRNKVQTLTAKTKSSSAMSASGCQTYEVEEWGESCIDAGPESEGPEPECTPYLIGIELVTICDPETGDPCIDYGDCETGDPCIDYGDCDEGGEDPQDCAGVAGGSAYIADCGCIGGTTGISECPPAPLDTTRNIVDSCINLAVDKAFAANLTGKMKDIMQNTILNNDQLKLKIRDSAWPDTLNGGYFRVISRTNITGTMVLNAEIVLNTSALSGSAEEYRVAVFFHEALHAYLATLERFTPGYLNNINDHSAMAYDYVDMLKATLQSTFPTLSSSDANALAWEGLHGTPFWALRSPQQQQSILQANQKFREGQMGSKCN